MKALERKNPKVKKAISELKVLSADKKSRDLYEERLKAELDYNSGIEVAYFKGEQMGIQKGSLSTLYLAIEIALKTKFTNGLSLLSRIKKIKDSSLLQNLLETILKAKDLGEVKDKLSSK